MVKKGEKGYYFFLSAALLFCICLSNSIFFYSTLLCWINIITPNSRNNRINRIKIKKCKFKLKIFSNAKNIILKITHLGVLINILTLD